ncbi:MAG: HEPN domain-containing protein [Phormidium tanganyikae FI6-MK23]|jgi:uncharacterized protein (UPF0332 family)|nr:HEPN domain-containing protein [Phormidium tanganyikae FI6-MK23]
MTPEQQALITKAQRSLKVAKLLAQEENYDFSASRAYYAMFYVAQALLLGKQLTFSTHSGVINAFGLHFIKSQEISADYHRALIAAERVRLQGDYDAEDEVSAEMAQQQIEWAERFLTLQSKL